MAVDAARRERGDDACRREVDRPVPRRPGRRGAGARRDRARLDAARGRRLDGGRPRRRRIGTIGGGQLEYMAIDAARAMLARRRATRTTLDVPLGPEIGQCCGGRTLLSVARLDADGWERAARHRRGRAARRCPRCMSSAPAMSAGRWRRRWRCCRCGRCWSTSARRSCGWRRPGIDALLTPLPEEAVRERGARRRLRRADPRPRARLPDRARGAGARRRRLCRHDRLAHQAGVVRALAGARATTGRGRTRAALVCPIGAAGRPDKRPEVIAAFVAAEIMQHLRLAGQRRRAAPRRTTQ